MKKTKTESAKKKARREAMERLRGYAEAAWLEQKKSIET